MHNHQIKVLNHLENGNTLTQAEAIELFKCYRLSAVINRLRSGGYDIETHYEKNTLSNGNHERYEMRGKQS